MGIFETLHDHTHSPQRGLMARLSERSYRNYSSLAESWEFSIALCSTDHQWTISQFHLSILRFVWDRMFAAFTSSLGSWNPSPPSDLHRIILAHDISFLSPQVNWYIIDLATFRTPIGRLPTPPARPSLNKIARDSPFCKVAPQLTQKLSNKSGQSLMEWIQIGKKIDARV